MEALALLVLGAVLGAVLGYFVRRNEHLRDQRLDAISDLTSAFVDAARAGADLLSVHMQTGYPHELNTQTWSAQQIDAMGKAHGDAWTAAADAAHRFELAVARAELVASKDTAAVVTDLRDVDPDSWTPDYAGDRVGRRADGPPSEVSGAVPS